MPLPVLSTGADIEACSRIAEEPDAKYRVREYNEVGEFFSSAENQNHGIA